MKPKKSERSNPQQELFKTRLESFLNLNHALVSLSQGMDWEYFNKEFGKTYSEKGRPGLPTRLMVGLTYLKHSYDLSDESLVEGFLENPYWQYFCGFEYFQNEFPCDPSSLTRYRQRLGEEGCEKLLRETLRLAHASRQLKLSHLKEVIVDTTAQEKNITHPTDAKLLNKAREKLVKAANKRGITLRQSYKRVGKDLVFRYSKYVHAKQYKRARRCLSKLKTILGRVMRDIERKLPEVDEELKELLKLCTRLYHQTKSSKDKIYSLHEPEVACIAKGKASKPYEFGCKTSVVTAARSTWVLGVASFHGNPHDSKTLKEAIANTEQNTGREIKTIFADKGYRGRVNWPKGKQVIISGRKRLIPVLAKLLKRRSAIEPVIGHMKRENRLSRNLLKGKLGDHLNAILAGTAFNFRKLISFFLDFFYPCSLNLSFSCQNQGPIIRILRLKTYSAIPACL